MYGTAWLEYSWKPTHLGSFNSLQNSSVPILTLEVTVCRRSVCSMALYGSTVRRLIVLEVINFVYSEHQMATGKFYSLVRVCNMTLNT